MRNAADEEIKISGFYDFNLSGGGAWKTRSHSSLFVATLITAEENDKVSGAFRVVVQMPRSRCLCKIIDIYVSSLYYKGCGTAKDIMSDKNRLKWKNQQGKACSKNQSCSATSMEVRIIMNTFCR